MEMIRYYLWAAWKISTAILTAGTILWGIVWFCSNFGNGGPLFAKAEKHPQNTALAPPRPSGQ
jgi:hypothetical protein